MAEGGGGVGAAAAPECQEQRQICVLQPQLYTTTPNQGFSPNTSVLPPELRVRCRIFQSLRAMQVLQVLRVEVRMSRRFRTGM